jgi:N6-L-threonylcarbamoyladenine synthase
LEGHLNAPLIEHPEIPLPAHRSGGSPAVTRPSTASRNSAIINFWAAHATTPPARPSTKVAKILGLGYPGGPIVDKKAKEGNAKAVKFPKPKVKGYDFSFSGLKTAAKQIVDRESPAIPDLCASFQETVVDILIDKTLAAAKNRRCKTVLVTGGVACNSRLRVKLTEEAAKKGVKAFFASPVLSTDNASMIAYVGGRRLMAKETSPLSLNAVASLALGVS